MLPVRIHGAVDLDERGTITQSATQSTFYFFLYFRACFSNYRLASAELQGVSKLIVSFARSVYFLDQRHRAIDRGESFVRTSKSIMLIFTAYL